MERSMKWVEQKDYRRFGCTECSWSHPNPSLRDDPATLDATVLNFIKRAFAAHFCDRYPAPKPVPAALNGSDGKDRNCGGAAGALMVRQIGRRTPRAKSGELIVLSNPAR